MTKYFSIFYFFLFWLTACAQTKKLSTDTSTNNLPVAFPGAEGWGKYTTGGRGGKVLIVSTLGDDGTGSLRQAIKTKGPKIIVFAISGTVHLASPLVITGDV
ncbi:MAG TPA: hypothetical protein VM888_12360, partial [Chitinophagaceae bacterium]|nr:hypothetical protein [Chitinophagaceae bacterium]